LSDAGRDKITTEVIEAPEFYFAEEYHQQYLAKNPDGYCGIGGTGRHGHDNERRRGAESARLPRVRSDAPDAQSVAAGRALPHSSHGTRVL